MRAQSTGKIQRSMMRRTIAGMLAMICLMIALTPLAPLAMHIKVVSHVVTGECVGDCDICGCSSENRANHTCCCAQKKHNQRSSVTLSAGSCCTAKSTATTEPAQSGCCAAAKPIETKVEQNDCCTQSKHHHSEDVQEAHPDDEKTARQSTVLKCGGPCGKGKLLALGGLGTYELLPNDSKERIEIIPSLETLFADHSHRMASCHGEPPDPPPKILRFS